MRLSIHFAAALFALAVAAPMQAQEAGDTEIRDELRTLVTETAPADRDRETVRTFLEREDVEAAADAYGLDLDRMKTGVGTLEADQARDLATRVQDTENQIDQVGGDTVVISSTLVLIGLLIIILLIVA